MKLVLDCQGGDKSPHANIDGALMALEKYHDLTLILTGDESELRSELTQRKADLTRIDIVHAPGIITGEDKPTDAIRLKKDSSMIAAINILRHDDSVSGVISTGATGALVSAATISIGRIRGIRRPAFCPIFPTMNGGIVGISDSGANVDIHPEQLLQFAIMGSAYLENVFGIKNPRVAMVNVGTESEKGDDLRKTAYPMLAGCELINFVGNMESRDFMSGNYDLVVCDGFSGNVLVKSTEGTALEMLKLIKRSIMSRTMYKLGALFMKKMFRELRDFMNYQNYGGSVLLGTQKTIVKGHGSSNATAVFKSIELAYRMESTHLNEKIADAVKRMRSDNNTENN